MSDSSDSDTDAGPRPSYLDSPGGSSVNADDFSLDSDFDGANASQIQTMLKAVYHTDRLKGGYLYVNQSTQITSQIETQITYNNSTNIWTVLDSYNNNNPQTQPPPTTATSIASSTATPLLPLIFYLTCGPSTLPCTLSSLTSYVLLYVHSYVDYVRKCAHECEGERLSMIVGVTLERMLDDGLEFRGGREASITKLNHLINVIITAFQDLKDRGLVINSACSSNIKLSSTGVLLLLERRSNILEDCEEVDRVNLKWGLEGGNEDVLRMLGGEVGGEVGCSLDVCDPGWRKIARSVDCSSGHGGGWELGHGVGGRRTPTYFLDSTETKSVQAVEWELTRNDAFFTSNDSSGVKRQNVEVDLFDDDDEDEDEDRNEDGSNDNENAMRHQQQPAPAAFKRIRRGPTPPVPAPATSKMDVVKKDKKAEDGDSCLSNDWSSAGEEEEGGYGGVNGFMEGGGEGDGIEGEANDNSSSSDSEEMVGSDSEDDSDSDDTERKKWDDDSLGDSDSDNSEDE